MTKDKKAKSCLEIFKKADLVENEENENPDKWLLFGITLLFLLAGIANVFGP